MGSLPALRKEVHDDILCVIMSMATENEAKRRQHGRQQRVGPAKSAPPYVKGKGRKRGHTHTQPEQTTNKLNKRRQKKGTSRMTQQRKRAPHEQTQLRPVPGSLWPSAQLQERPKTFWKIERTRQLL